MTVTDKIRGRIEDSIRVKQALLEQAPLLQTMAETWTKAIRSGRKVLFFGNGGSAADAQHLVCELAGRFYLDRKPVPALSLTVNTSSLTAIANDYSYDDIFSRQLLGVGQEGDVAVGLSTSGTSRNVVRALEEARGMGMVTVGWTGRDGKDVRDLSDLWLGVDSDDTPRVQEGHILVGHIVCELTEHALFG